MGIVSFSILIWDHMITFGDEVRLHSCLTFLVPNLIVPIGAIYLERQQGPS